MLEYGYYQLLSGSRIFKTATVGLLIEDELFQDSACGEGPIKAVFNAIDCILHLEIELRGYSLQAKGLGKEAVARVRLEISDSEGRIFEGEGQSQDIIEACALAYIDAINNLLKER